MALRSSKSSTSIFWISWLVRKPSKKCCTGMCPLIALRCATAPMSMASCTLEEASWAQPIWRQAITSEWSPKMDTDSVATLRAATCMTAGSCRPAMRYIGGIISIRP